MGSRPGRISLKGVPIGSAFGIAAGLRDRRELGLQEAVSTSQIALGQPYSPVPSVSIQITRS